VTRQLGLFGPTATEEQDDDCTAARFERFHEANPHVLLLIVSMARELRETYRLQRCGIRFIWNSLRWLHHVETNGDGRWKLSNDFTSFYSRVAMCAAPDLAGFFELRPMTVEYDVDLDRLDIDAPL